MISFKKIAGWIVAVLCVLFLVGIVAGIFGSWVVRNQVTDATVKLLTAGETLIDTASQGFQRVDDRLQQSVDRVNEIEGRIEELGTDLEQNSIIVNVLDTAFGDELGPIISDLRATVEGLANTIFAINDAIDAANNIPLVNLNGTLPTAINDLTAGIIQLDEDVQAAKAEVQAKRQELIEGTVTGLTDRTSRINSRLVESQGKINAVQSELDQTSANFSSLKTSLVRTYTYITLLIDVVLLLFALAFISLLFHAISLIKNPEQSFKELTA